jgi:hypothetical protein
LVALRILNQVINDRIAEQVSHAAIGVIAVGLAAQFLLASLGFAFARRYRLRIWVDASIGDAHRRHVWPPACTGSRNTLDNLVGLMSLELAAIIAMALMFAFFLVFFGVNTVRLIEATFVLGILPWLALFAAKGTIASIPSECWEKTSDQL